VGFRGESSHVPVPHLAAGRAYGSAHGGLGDSGQRAVEDGDVRFPALLLPLLPDAAKNHTVITVMAVLSIIGIVYGALASLMQKDWKKLVAYSSVSHLGFCTLGIFSLNPAGIAGSIIQQINHGISTGMLFLIVGVVYERRHTREIVRIRRPAQGDADLHADLRPGGAQFHGDAAAERLHRRNHHPERRVSDVARLGVLGSVGIALGAAYLLWLFQRTMLGEVK
jgi:NADH-quinone oxidoreductase subunit M